MLLRDRLDEALDYLEDHPDMTVVVSGGQGPDEPTSEAQAMADYLTAHGVGEGEGAPGAGLPQHRPKFRLFQTAAGPGGDRHLGRSAVGVQRLHLTRARMLAERAGFEQVSTLAAPASHFALPAVYVCPGAAGPGEVLPVRPGRLGAKS